jgi:hypothetical protein
LAQKLSFLEKRFHYWKKKKTKKRKKTEEEDRRGQKTERENEFPRTSESRETIDVGEFEITIGPTIYARGAPRGEFYDFVVPCWSIATSASVCVAFFCEASSVPFSRVILF